MYYRGNYRREWRMWGSQSRSVPASNQAWIGRSQGHEISFRPFPVSGPRLSGSLAGGACCRSALRKSESSLMIERKWFPFAESSGANLHSD